jgi:glycerol-3-phosphate dehydrogenase (NAD(P)+)
MSRRPVDPAAPSIAVVGAGAWGTTLAAGLGERFPRVTLWVFEADLADEIRRSRENRVYLPGIPIPESVRATASLAEALADAGLILFVVPSHVFRRVATQAAAHVHDHAVVASATKGIEVDTLATMSDILAETLPSPERRRLGVVSGPSFAWEVANRRPTALVAASACAGVAETMQRVLASETLRVYGSLDPRGVELGGAVKNVIAIAAGIVDGLELGLNARAALITRGLAEMTRLGLAMGAEAATFAGLAGMGDLILTATGDLSRNRRLGIAIAQGRRLSDLLAESRAVAEGVNTCRSVVRLAERHQAAMPIARAVHRVLFEGQAPREAALHLMSRELRFENE